MTRYRAALAALMVTTAALLGGCGDKPAPPICTTLEDSKASTDAMSRSLNGVVSDADSTTLTAEANRLRTAASVEGAPVAVLNAAATAADGIADREVTAADIQNVADSYSRLGEELGETCN